MNVHQECNLVSMENASHVHVELSELKAFNQHVSHVRWVAPHQRLDLPLLKNVHCQFAHPELTSTLQSTSASSATKVITNPSRNKLHAFHAHQITAQRTLPPPQRLNVQTPVKLQLKVINIAMQMLIAFLFLKLQTSSANVNLASTERARHA